MGTKTFRVTGEMVDDATGKTDWKGVNENAGLDNLTACDMQDLLQTGYIDPLRAKGRAFAQAKADSAAQATS
jgi:hypothetical protein